MFGHCAPSAIAAALAASFFSRLTNGFTQIGGITRTLWPLSRAKRLQKWLVPTGLHRVDAWRLLVHSRIYQARERIG